MHGKPLSDRSSSPQIEKSKLNKIKCCSSNCLAGLLSQNLKFSNFSYINNILKITLQEKMLKLRKNTRLQLSVPQYTLRFLLYSCHDCHGVTRQTPAIEIAARDVKASSHVSGDLRVNAVANIQTRIVLKQSIVCFIQIACL